MPPVPAPLGHSQPSPARSTPGPFARPPRVLILTAPVGEGHDLPARVLAQALEADAVPEVVDTLPLLGSMVEGVAARAMRTTLDGRGMGWVFDLEYALFARFAPTRVLGRSGLHTASARRLGAAVRQHAPDVVVSTYPISSEVLGHLRLRRRLDVPVCSVITDLAGLRYWAHPGVDLHLIAYPESAAEVERIARRPARAVSGLTAPSFLNPPPRELAREALGVGAGSRVVTVSGGGWAVGDLAGAADAALSVGGVTVVVACGRNERVRASLASRYAGEPRLRTLGFVEEMATLLQASDVLVHSTAGLTVLEGYMLGCSVISYGWPAGHIRPNNRAFRRYGIAEVARSADQLQRAIGRALSARRTIRTGAFSRLPRASDLIVGLARAPASS